MNRQAEDTFARSVLPSSLPFAETEHARLRREQRNIDKKDLNAALRYGTCSPSHWHSSRYIYKYNHITYIVEEEFGTLSEVTCYAEPLTLERVPITNAMVKIHNQAQKKIRKDFFYWTSNTVMVVDTSGSMKKGDVWGTRNRLDSVWMAIALDFLAARLESGIARETDVISIVEMSEESTIVFECVPTTWVLFNKIVDLYNEKESVPHGHGFYLPSLEVADELLMKNSSASCAPALLFLSDGAPSDQVYLQAPKGLNIIWRDESMINTIESLAKKFGRQLTFTAVGIGSENDFELLQRMVYAAKDYGAIAEFVLPFMTSSSLGNALSSVASSLTKTQIEMTELGTSKQRKIRAVLRESKSKAKMNLTQISREDFDLYHVTETTRKIYREEHSSERGKEAFYDEVPLQHPDAQFVAFAKEPFEEGAERFVFRFFEIASDKKTIVGFPLVAKESRFILDEAGVDDETARKKFVQTFCKAQQIARRLALKFNERLDSNPRVHADTPRVSVLDCSIYELNDAKLGRLSVLVERRLDESKWYKWNSNNGMVNGVKAPVCKDKHLTQQYKAAQINPIATNFIPLSLEKIDEQSDDEDSGSSENDEANDHKDVDPVVFTPSQVAQAFSHFSFCHTQQKRLVCDLQGVFDNTKNELQFSDPVIHYFNSRQDRRRNVHGRTDRGRKGMDDFFWSHCCKEQNHLCQLVSRGFVPIRRTDPQANIAPIAKPQQPLYNSHQGGARSTNEFPLLQRMADAAKDFGACASFMLPSMTTSSLGEAMTSVATSLTSSQMELTDIGTMKQRKARDVLRESKSKASEKLRCVSDVDFYLYSWEDITRKIYREEHSFDGKRHVFYDAVPLQHPDARYVALSKCPFGEGSERFVHRFYEIASDKKTILGVPMVVKESRMVLEEEHGGTKENTRRKFVETFCETQQLARRLAIRFNEKLESNLRIHPYTPRVSFLDCSIYELDDTKVGRLMVLVENRLDEKQWYKWNSNNGIVNGVRKMHGKSHLTQQNKAARINSIAANIISFDRMDIIEEGVLEDEDLSVTDEGEMKGDEKSDHPESIVFTPSQVAQAFSHFSYCASNRNRLVCDLQGVFDEAKNELQFSDPVIHYYYNTNLDHRRNVHGRTDRGRKGMDDFFRSHCCKDQNHLCQLVSRGFCRPHRHVCHQNAVNCDEV